MTNDQKKDVYNTAKNSGYHASNDGSKLVNGFGSSISFVGTNRTVVDGNTYYGASSAKNAINKR